MTPVAAPPRMPRASGISRCHISSLFLTVVKSAGDNQFYSKSDYGDSLVVCVYLFCKIIGKEYLLIECFLSKKKDCCTHAPKVIHYLGSWATPGHALSPRTRSRGVPCALALLTLRRPS